MGRIDEKQLSDVLWSARSAGSRMILPCTSDRGLIALLKELGLVREQLGHMVLTPTGVERRRRCSPYPALSA
ncbi:hypothetical protein ASG29_14725 [Sphingomonas sp. Leaf412]|uniref:hypothetical protein n=1 Tax=Sphingomonas sp. Leaf412 TaxID=1736370 RepID=UPI0006F3EE19|nr:hypothetical protein [Sphingomonas sp. Leaf412]KQT31226.1 hypothetical protein ASG29_14725 [Sphingomonas sp. Leaf412]